jgi:CheY-like chemotaxis protein
MVVALRPGKRILVVEDDPDTRAMLASILETIGHQVDTAANGQEALQHLHGRFRPDLILLDLMMPVMDGWEFRQHQNQDPELAAIPVVLLSAADDGRRRREFFGTARYLQKPFGVETLAMLSDLFEEIEQH